MNQERFIRQAKKNGNDRRELAQDAAGSEKYQDRQTREAVT